MTPGSLHPQSQVRGVSQRWLCLNAWAWPDLRGDLWDCINLKRKTKVGNPKAHPPSHSGARRTTGVGNDGKYGQYFPLAITETLYVNNHTIK